MDAVTESRNSSSDDENESKRRPASLGPSQAASSKRCRLSTDAENNVTFDEDSCCSICFEPYSNSGNHRLTCLRCGHLFGRSCIKKWLGEKGAAKRNCCPQCKARAKLSDLRNHYCKGIKVVDTSEKEEALKALKEERKNSRMMQIELATLRQKCDSLQNQVAEMEHQLKRAKERCRREIDENSSSEQQLFSKMKSSRLISSTSASDSDNSSSSTALKLDREFFQRLEISRDSDSRVMDICPGSDLLAASAKQTNALFHNYGLRKVDLFSLRCESFVPLHADVIRDVKINNAKALTASFDKTVVLSDLRDNHVIARWKIGQRVWSCSQNTSDSNYIFAATQNGKVRMFDIRSVQTRNDADQSEYVLEICDLKKPIFNLHWVQNAPPINSGRSGLLVSSIDQCAFYEYKSPNAFDPHILPVEGRLYSVSYDDESAHFLISFGPSTSKRLVVEHSLYQLTRRLNNISDREDASVPMMSVDYYTCDFVRSFNGGHKQSLMCRNYLAQHPRDPSSLIAFTYSEADNAVQVWNASDGRLTNRLNLQNESIYDIRYFNNRNRRHLALLNNKYLTLQYLE